MSKAGKIISLCRQYGLKRTFSIAAAKFQSSCGIQRKKAVRLVSRTLKYPHMPDEKLKNGPVLSILMPVYNTDIDMLKCVIESVMSQTYGRIELCISDAGDGQHADNGRIIREYTKKDSRIKYVKSVTGLGISENTVQCMKLATGTYYGLLDHDDVLHPSAACRIMECISETGADFIYTDEAAFSDRITNVVTLNLKPDYAPDMLRCNNYICHFTVFSKELYEKTEGFRKEYDGSQDHDLILRLTDKAEKICHIPEVLYFWRLHKNSVGYDINAKEYAVNAGINAVKDFLEYRHIKAEVESSDIFPTIYRIRYEIKDNPLVSVIILNKNHKKDLSRCIESVRKSTYRNYEIIIVENNSTDEDITEYYEELKKEGNIKIITRSGKFNYSEYNNAGVKEAAGEIIVFMNNDVEVINPSWLEEMLMYAQQKKNGAVGAKLLYPDRTIQHCYIVTGVGEDHVAVHAGAGLPEDDYGYMDRIGFVQNVSAVTGACLMIRKKLFNAAGGFDEKLPLAYNDVDLCLRIREMGYYNVYTPYALLYHYESSSRGGDDTGSRRKRLSAEAEYMKNKWQDEIRDPYYNPNFSREKAYILR